MIFAEMDYPNDYWDIHQELDGFLRTQFSRVESGLQSDSWYWIFDGDQKVAIDTFSSAKHQVKCSVAGPHVNHVIETLRVRYHVKVYVDPVLEGHEDPAP